ncbi:hypothetical protein PHLGIDRAFT_120764 [Phlebiopsis gigantea 11061_1 CR5-6]|uniref:Uncharacterized protein n=1 Tax=Phlebiopsis gigantea (strain 11061_1 CR5-6) TaxID=745531 RepID=A0A0C3S3E3_PHLG1|nr:hypothetical protein PHLGIDRAFT_120764 [Phlebiopsis gigantea 11061_1 CR5-6]
MHLRAGFPFAFYVHILVDMTPQLTEDVEGALERTRMVETADSKSEETHMPVHASAEETRVSASLGRPVEIATTVAVETATVTTLEGPDEGFVAVSVSWESDVVRGAHMDEIPEPEPNETKASPILLMEEGDQEKDEGIIEELLQDMGWQARGKKDKPSDTKPRALKAAKEREETERRKKEQDKKDKEEARRLKAEKDKFKGSDKKKSQDEKVKRARPT